MHTLRLIYCALALVAFTAAAQTMQVVPVNPTTADEVILQIDYPTIGWQITQTGNHFRLDLNSCPFECFEPTPISLGMLPAGTYTYEIFSEDEDPPIQVASGTFVVAAAALPDAPTLSPAALAALCLILVGAGCFFIGRQT
jgi:hypothetical protein